MDQQPGDTGRQSGQAPHEQRNMLMGIMFGFVGSQSLRLAGELGVVDALAERPMLIDELAERTGTHAPSLRRMLRVLTALGVLRECTPDVVELTESGQLLRSDSSDPLRHVASLFCGPSQWRIWEALDHSIRTGEPAFPRVHGMPIYEHAARDREAARTLDEGLGAEARFIAEQLAAHYRFTPGETLVDVGGGNGVTLAVLLTAHPELRGVLADLRADSVEAVSTLRNAGVAGRCRLVRGDFFETVPTGGDVYLLKSVVQDWGDEHVLRLLRRVHEAMPEQARLLVVDPVRPDTEVGLDIAMHDLVQLAAVGGRDRSEFEFAELLEGAGFRVDHIGPFGAQDIYQLIEASPVPSHG